MHRSNSRNLFLKSASFPVKISFLSASLLLISHPAHGLDFHIKSGSIDGSFDTTISLGAGIRLEDRDNSLVGFTNGGTGSSSNTDDANLNYDQGDVYSTVLKVSHELDVSWKNYGLFVRGYYFKDFAESEKFPLGPRAEQRVKQDEKLLDFFVRGSFDIAAHNLEIRLGQQVVNWGESTFIQNGINTINAVDVTRLRSPGSEIKEALLPAPMIWSALELTDNLSVEAFAITHFREIEIDPRGTYFSTNDTVSEDSDRVYLGADQHGIPDRWVPRGKDRIAKNGGEFGLAFRWFSPEMNNSEFGLYFINYHQRAPIASVKRGGIISTSAPFPVNVPCSAPPNPACIVASEAANYFVEYPEDVKLYGMSFNTTGPFGTALQGEYSYRPNLPMQLAIGELFNAALGLPNTITGTNPLMSNGVPMGTEISGYRRIPMHQLQLTVSKFLPNVFKADRLLLMGEIGYTYLDLPDNLLFAGYGETAPVGSFGAPLDPAQAGKGYATRSSWGYILRASADYNSAIGALMLQPTFSFSHAVNGRSPTWNEDVKSLSLGLNAYYQDRWKASLNYTAYFGGKKYYPTPSLTNPFATVINTNRLADRDFLSLSISFSF